MNQLRSRLLRQQELSRHPHEEVQRKAPRNLSEVTSAFEINLNNPPLNMYNRPQRYKILEEQKTYNVDQKKTTFRKILDEIEQEVEQQSDPKPIQMAEMRQSQYSNFGKFPKQERTQSNVVLKKANITYKSSAGGNQYQTQATSFGTSAGLSLQKRPTTDNMQQRQLNINYHMEQIRSLKNIKNEQPVKQAVIKDGESDIVKVQESSLKQLTSIIKPQMTQEEARRIDKQLSVQKNLIERNDMLPKAPFFPNKRQQQNLIIYNEIFVIPKQKEIEKLKQQEEDNLDLLSNQKIIQKVRREKEKLEKIKETKNVDLNHSNMLNESQHDLRRSTMKGFIKTNPNEKIIQFDDGGENFIHELDILGSPEKRSIMQEFQQEDDSIDIIELIMRKFNSGQKNEKSKKNQKKSTMQTQSVFTQQIHVQQPEGYNASVASPLAPGGGWAPSLPSGNVNIMKTSLQDMTMRARAGIQIGDVQKEAHMAYCLGVLNEQQQNQTQAVNFYKRFFFCARMLDDPIGASLALNRIGVAYYKKRKISKSLKFHLKHFEFSDKENVFAAYYNIGICYRIQGQNQKALDFFKKALEWAQYREDSESSCLCFGQLGIVSLLEKNNEDAIYNFERCFELSQEMKNQRLQLDCLLCLGYICIDKQDWEQAKGFFDQAYFKAKQMCENSIAEQCLCNAGIASGNIMINQQKQIMDQFYRTSGMGFGLSNQQNFDDDEDEEEEEEEEVDQNILNNEEEKEDQFERQEESI